MEKTGFDYFLEEEILRDYQQKSLKLRLKWLYYGNKFRQQAKVKGQGKDRGRVSTFDITEK